MATGTQSELSPNGNRFYAITLALLAGLIVASFLFFLIATIQTPGLDPPPETAALFIVVTTAGVISYQLLRWHLSVGYPAAIVTGGMVFLSLGLVLGGTYGAAGPRTNPIGPVSYTLLAVAVVIAAGLAWRNESMDDGSTSSPSAP